MFPPGFLRQISAESEISAHGSGMMALLRFALTHHEVHEELRWTVYPRL
jgi:hypothetical protein